jgi:hypothetical protein
LEENNQIEEVQYKHHLYLQVSNEGISLVKNTSKWHDLVDNETNFIPWNNIQQFDQFLIDHQVQKKNITDITVEIIHQLFLLIPNEYNSSLFQMSYLEKALGSKEIIGKEIHEQTCAKEEAQFIFLVKSEWKDFFAFKFPLAKLTYEHIFGNLIIHHNRFLRTQFNIYLINKKLAFVICRKNGKLQIANMFEYQSAIELAFYIHSIKDAFELVWTNDLLQIAGPDSTNTTLIQSLIDLKVPISLK